MIKKTCNFIVFLSSQFLWGMYYDVEKWKKIQTF